MEALRRFDFDTVMFPVSAAIWRNREYTRDAEALIAEAAARNVGVQCIKMLGAAAGAARPGVRHVVRPAPRTGRIDAALWWLLSQPIHTAPSTGEPAWARYWTRRSGSRLSTPRSSRVIVARASSVDGQRPPEPSRGSASFRPRERAQALGGADASFGGKVVRALRYAPVKAPALLRVIGWQGRQRWIPAFAGMTVVHARMTVVQRPPFKAPGMTVARESRFVETTVKGRADRRRDAESSSERR